MLVFADKSRAVVRSVAQSAKGIRNVIGKSCVLAAVAVGLLGCNRMVTPRGTQVMKDAEAKAADGRFLEAIALYESALHDPSRTAEIHYRLALLYDDKMHEPLNALHHFKRYLTLEPSGPKAAEVKNFMKRDELAMMTTMSGDSLVTRAEAARLKNENLALRKEADERAAQLRNANSTSDKKAKAGRTEKSAASPKPANIATRSHVVQPGDTLFSLSRLYFNAPDRWKDILELNNKSIDDPEKLKIGQTLAIP